MAIEGRSLYWNSIYEQEGDDSRCLQTDDGLWGVLAGFRLGKTLFCR